MAVSEFVTAFLGDVPVVGWGGRCMGGCCGGRIVGLSRGSGEPGRWIGGLLLPDLLGQPGFATVIADAVGPAVSALVAGQDPTVVITAAPRCCGPAR
ncbi:MAG: hypothetical protein R2763_01690 [Mycobacterium sp.]